MSIICNDEGIYRLNGFDKIGVVLRRLDDAWVSLPDGAVDGEGAGCVQPAADAQEAFRVRDAAAARKDARVFGWIMGGVPAPSKGDRYIVEFTGKNEFRILAYMDRFGRVFSESEAIEAPPAREPDLALARFAPKTEGREGKGAGKKGFARAHERARAVVDDESGCVQIRLRKGGMRQVAQYHRQNQLYSLFDTWYNFADHADKLSYADALTRCYIAFVHRPSLGARAVPTRDFASVRAAMRDKAPLAALESIVGDVRDARRDAALRPPALVGCLADWLEEAGLERVVAAVRAAASEGAGKAAEPLRLVRTARYANTYYLGKEDEVLAAVVSERDIWALEAALNRFLLVGEAFGEQASLAPEEACRHADARLFERIGVQALDAARTADADGDPAGEWQVRKAIGTAMENLRLPVRYFATFKADIDSGIVAFDVTVPDAELMGKFLPRDASEDGARVFALRYAQRLGIVLAAAAFHSSRLIQAVMVSAHAVGCEGNGAFPRYRVLFDREDFCEGDAYRKTVEGDPAGLFEAHGARYGENEQGEPFDVVDHMGSAAVRRDAPEDIITRFQGEAAERLGARNTCDLRIYYEGILRHMGETLADHIVRSASTSEAIGYVRAVQNDTDDPRVYEACTRLMTALVEGTVDATDQNAVVTCFIGEDRYQRALMQARAVASHDADAAVSILRTVVAEAEASGAFADNAETVHRVFDSYASRVVYNLQRPEADCERRVELAPVSLLLCYLDALKLLEESFEHADEARRLGERAMEMAPTFTVAYRQTARACMLTGDLESSSRILKRCLAFALQDDEIAIAYYQLAYVEWKAGRARAGAACYAKSIVTSPVYAAQSAVELQELMTETQLETFPREKVDEVLSEEGIPVAPNVELLGKLDAAVAAAVDANVFSVARSLLSACLRHHPDDALTNVLRSL